MKGFEIPDLDDRLAELQRAGRADQAAKQARATPMNFDDRGMMRRLAASCRLPAAHWLR